MTFDTSAAVRRTAETWDRDILPTLADYIRIPAVSSAFDPDWAEHGHLDGVVELARQWCEQREVEELVVEVIRLPGRSPLLWFEVPASHPSLDDDTVLLYGHLDKQPPMLPWRDGLGPWEPVLTDGRLYGRGGADDGYAVFASLTAIEAVQAEDGRHARCVGMIETSEESGSPDLPAYVDHLADRIGTPSLVVCLDSFCGDYDGLWTTTSLRGMASARLTVEVLTEGVHSGSAGGVVPSSFRILRGLLDRVEDVRTGRILTPELWADVPAGRLAEIQAVADELGTALTDVYPFVDGAGPLPLADDPDRSLYDPATLIERPAERDIRDTEVAADRAAIAADLLRARTWEPALATIGAAGFPDPQSAGNVLRPWSTLALSVRLPPTVDADVAMAALARDLTADPPYGAHVTVDVSMAETGWDAPATAPWLTTAMAEASAAAFGAPARALGEGGSIPFMGMLGHRFPEAQFLLTGVLGPGSNAHGPNEFLHVATGKRVTACVAHVLDAHARRR